MSDLQPLRTNVQLQGCQFRSGVSESLIQAMAGNNNFVNYFQTIEKTFTLNGIYGNVSTPFQFDGLDVFEFNSQIIDVWAYVFTTGSSGTTTIDCQISPAPGSPFVSIFSTLPSIAFNAVGPTWVGVVNPSLVGSDYIPPTYTPPANTTRPVLNLSVVNSITAWSGMQCLVNAAAVAGQNCGLTIRYRRI